MNILDAVAGAGHDRDRPAADGPPRHVRARERGISRTDGYLEFRYAYSVLFRGEWFSRRPAWQASVTQCQRSRREQGPPGRKPPSCRDNAHANADDRHG